MSGHKPWSEIKHKKDLLPIEALVADLQGWLPQPELPKLHALADRVREAEELRAGFQKEAEAQQARFFRELERTKCAEAGLYEIIEEFRKGQPRGSTEAPTYDENDPVVEIARRVLYQMSQEVKIASQH